MKLVLIFASICLCFTVRYNVKNCEDKQVEIMQKIHIDTVYQCSTFVVDKDTVFLEYKIEKEFPKTIIKLGGCK